MSLGIQRILGRVPLFDRKRGTAPQATQASPTTAIPRAWDEPNA
jgi:hypothetical protein